MLRIEGLTVTYNKVVAVRELSLNLDEGNFITLIGSNGAGKSTTLRTISGLVPAANGRISFEGEEIQNRSPDQIVRLGIAHVPEGRRVFKELSVLENLYLGAFIRNDQAALGLAPVIVQEIARILADLNKQRGMSMILVEQNAELALELADYAYVLETGQLALEGDAQDLMGNEHVRSAYLGV